MLAEESCFRAGVLGRYMGRPGGQSSGEEVRGCRVQQEKVLHGYEDQEAAAPLQRNPALGMGAETISPPLAPLQREEEALCPPRKGPPQCLG